MPMLFYLKIDCITALQFDYNSLQLTEIDCETKSVAYKNQLFPCQFLQI